MKGCTVVNPDIQGRVYPPTLPYLVGREKVREFARAVLSESPLHHDPGAARAAGFADVVAPPTFPIVVQDLTLPPWLSSSPTTKPRLTSPVSCTAISSSPIRARSSRATS